MIDQSLEKSPLNKKDAYISSYQPDLLFAQPRKIPRETIGISVLPFAGNDVWNAYELSWLNAKGKPVVAAGEFIFPCTSPNLIESKSFKLYLNSFNNTLFDSFTSVASILERDLSAVLGNKVNVNLF